MLENDRDAAALVSTWVATQFSDYALLSELQRQLDLFQPWASAWRKTASQVHLDNWYHNVLHWRHDISHAVELHCRIHTIDPNDPGMAYPADKPRTEKTAWQMRKAESLLDKFWSGMDEFFRDWFRDSSQSFEHYFREHKGSLYRTEPWVEPAVAQSSMPNQSYVPLPHIAVELPRFDRKACGCGPKAAARSTARTPGAENAKPDIRNQTDSNKISSNVRFEKKSVDKHTYRVIQILFHSPSLSRHPGELPWKDFLQAMLSIGLAPQKLFGSVWLFRPSESGLRSICFHEPHPHHKIAFTLARRIGRRLSRVYGWSSKTFVEV